MPRRRTEPRPNEWIQEILDRKELRQSDMARATGLPPERINEIIAGKRKVQFEESDKISRYLGLTIAEFKLRLIDKKQLGAPLGVVQVTGFAEAGAVQMSAERQAGDWYEAPMAALKLFAGYPQYAVEIRGDSVNRRYPNGSLVAFVRFTDLKRDPRVDEWLIVHRLLGDGVEVSVRQLRRRDADGTLWLWLDSTDPTSQQALPANLDGLLVYGLVIGSYQPENVQP